MTSIYTIMKRAYLLDELIQKGKTGNLEMLSKHLGVSKRHTYNYLKALEDIGKEHKFDDARNSFVYLEREQ